MNNPIEGQLLGGRYRIISTLASGGFGQTYVALDTHRPGSPRCVVKQLKPLNTGEEVLKQARRLFAIEAETLERLGHHSQIPRLLAYFEVDDEFYLVMEYIDGHPLSQEIQPGQRWTEMQVRQMLKEVLDILEFVHSNGVIHRDIKPDNLIRRSHDQKLVLVDFGAVKQVRASLPGQAATVFTIAVGTLGYLPSEQRDGHPRFNSDVYALGMTAVQALTGFNPGQLHSDPDTLELVWEPYADASIELKSILGRMLRYHFRERYQAVTEVLQSLGELTNLPPIYPYGSIGLSTSSSIPPINTSAVPPQASSHIEDSAIVLQNVEHTKNKNQEVQVPLCTVQGVSENLNRPNVSTDPQTEVDFKKATSGKLLILREQAQRFQVKFAESLKQQTNQPVVFHVCGIGGVGKTTLLQELKQENAQQAHFVEVTFDLGLDIETPLKLMAKLYEKTEKVTQSNVRLQGVLLPIDPFTSLYEKYKQTLYQLETQPVEGKGSVSPEQLNTVKELVKLGFSTIGHIAPIPGFTAPTLEKLATTSVDTATLLLSERERWQRLLQRHWSTRKKRELQELILNPLSKLTQAFAEGLIRKARKHPIVLVLDTFEKASPEINTWLWQYLISNTELRHHKIRLLMAGRYKLLKMEGWHRLHQNWQAIYESELDRLSEQQTQTYLTQININQDTQIQSAYRATKGLPYSLNWIREQKEQGIEIDFSQSYDEVSKVLLQGLNANQKRVVQLAACCRWFDRQVLEYLLSGQRENFHTADDEQNSCFEWLIRRDFVKIVQHRYRLDDVARDLFRLSLWQEDPDLFYRTHTLLSKYFEQRAAQQISPNSSIAEQLENFDWRTQTIEVLYHQFFSHPGEHQRQALTSLAVSSPLNQTEVIKTVLTAINAEADITEHPLLSYEARKALTIISNTVVEGTNSRRTVVVNATQANQQENP